MKRALGIAMAFIGLIVGAGFASGQEMMQFFVAFGTMGIVGAVIASLIMTVSGIAAFQLGSYTQATEHTAVFRLVSPRAVAGFMDLVTIATLFAIGFVMFAGGGANMAQQFDWPVWAGATLTLAAVLVAGMFDVSKVTRIIGVMTPFIIVFLVGASLWSIATADADVRMLNVAAAQVRTTLPNWWVGALNYVGLCVVTAVSMAIVMGGDVFDTRAAGVGGLLGGLLFLVLLTLSVVALFLQVRTVGSDELPMLALVDAIHPTLGAAMSVVVFAMIFNTALGMFYALGKRLTRRRPEWFRRVYIASVLVGFGLSFIGFRELVSYVYPALGYLGLGVIVAMGAGWLRGRETMSAESARRQRLRALATLRLDPRQEFTDRDAAELRELSEDSNLSTSDLHAIIVDRAEKALAADPEVDYVPLPDDAEPTGILSEPGPAEGDPSGPEHSDR
ncbi:hypothetical protein WCE41_00340 [Luteimonas sp. MJ246]|uniref:YkvI family membrane protein n=1 Tax=Luteimonas sp. MJ174 TaxID=3129237 RepID=UPI0031BBBA0B